MTVSCQNKSITISTPLELSSRLIWVHLGGRIAVGLVGLGLAEGLPWGAGKQRGSRGPEGGTGRGSGDRRLRSRVPPSDEEGRASLCFPGPSARRGGGRGWGVPDGRGCARRLCARAGPHPARAVTIRAIRFLPVCVQKCT